MAFSFLVLAPVAMREPWESHRRTLEKQWRGVVYIGSFMALNIALNNISLLDISLTLNQIIRCVGVGAGCWVRAGCWVLAAEWVRGSSGGRQRGRDRGRLAAGGGEAGGLRQRRTHSIADPAPCLWLLPCTRRSAIPVVTCLLAIAVEGRYPSRQELTALTVLTLGVMLAVWQVRCAACGARRVPARVCASCCPQ